jgi:hypothetical protein
MKNEKCKRELKGSVLPFYIFHFKRKTASYEAVFSVGVGNKN